MTVSILKQQKGVVKMKQKAIKIIEKLYSSNKLIPDKILSSNKLIPDKILGYGTDTDILLVYTRKKKKLKIEIDDESVVALVTDGKEIPFSDDILNLDFSEALNHFIGP
jgi:hypothetical protein